MKIKKINLLIIIMQILMMIFPSIFSIADTINIGDTLHVERGELGFYTIQYWSDYRNKWMYITYSRTYYTDSEGNKQIAYCMDPDLDGVGWLPGEDESYDTEVKYKLEDERIWRILKNGYPNVTLEALGVETEDDAYLATKQAVYCILKNRKLEDIRSFYRAGETEINNQNLEDIQRRGKKVVEAIYKLVDIAYNQTNQNMKEAEIIELSNFAQDEDGKCYSKKYKVTDSNLNTEIKIITEYYNQNIFFADENGNPKRVFKPGEIFKLMVKKESILGDNIITFEYEKNTESYPIYYAASKVDGKQNYAILTNKIEKTTGSMETAIKGYLSNVKIIKTDAETGKPIPGVTFQIAYDYGVKMGKSVTDQNGVAYFKNFHQGNMIVKEIETNEEYVLDASEYKVPLGYNETYILNISNIHKKGNLEIEKVDKDDNKIHLSGVEFDLIDKEENIIRHLITDDEGKATVNDINTGEYTLKETKTKQEYKIGVEQNVTINWNDTVELKIMNEKKKGNIKVVKYDKEDENIKLPGVKFEILNAEDEVIQTLITDESGEAVSEKIPVGTYYIKEIETGEKYVLDDKKIEVKVEEDKTNEIRIENARKKGRIKILKVGEDRNNVLNLEKDSPILGAKFIIYNQENKIMEEIETDKNGIATSKELEVGKYTVQEVETNKWYILDTQKQDVEIKNNGEIVEIKATNKSKNPQVEISKKCKNVIKPNEEIDYSFKIKNSGNTDLEKFTWYDILPSKYAKITKIETGTYNQDIFYNIFYKTNKKDEYMVIKKEINSHENNYIDLTNIYLDEGEEITEIKICFENVKIGFESIDTPHIFMKVKEEIDDGTSIENHTILEGYNLDYKTTDEDIAVSIVHNVSEKKKLPRTGY